MSRVETNSIVGLTLADGWAQVCSNHNQQLTAALAIKGDRANNLGRELVNQINQSSLDSAAALHHLMLDLLRSARDGDNQLQLAVGLIENNKLIIGTYNGSVLLKRTRQNQTQIGTILSSTTEPKLIQGKLQPSDTLVLMTNQAKQIKPSLINFLNNQKQVESSLLTQQLHQQPDSSLSALALVELSDSQNLTSAPAASQTDLKKTPALKQTTQAENNAAKQSKKQIEAQNKFQDNLRPGRSRQAAVHTKPTGSKSSKVKVEAASRGQQETTPTPSSSSKNKFAQIFRSILKKAAPVIKKIPKLFLTGIKSLLLIPGKMLELVQNNNSNDIYLGQNKKKKTVRIILIIAAVLALAGGLFFFWQEQRRQKRQEIVQAIQPALTLESEARQLQTVDLIEARNKTEEAINFLSNLKQERSNDILAQQIIREKLDPIKQFYQTINTDSQLDQLDLVYDLRQIETNFIGSDMLLIQNNLYVLDQEKQQVINLHLETQETQIIDLNSEVSAVDLAAAENELYILGQGIYYYSPGQTSSAESEAEDSTTNQIQEGSLVQIKEPGDSDRAAVSLDGFSSYLYVLNPEKRNIYRYLIDDQELSEPIGWLTNKQGLDFNQASTISINGFIWLGNQDGKINKLSKGEPVRFNLETLEPPLSSLVDIATHHSSYSRR